jgi:uncharacterized membrane protein YtjA (UPF0391 family)
MLRWSLGFLIVALIAGLFGFTPIAGATYEVARILFFGFLILFVASLLFDDRAPRDVY